jgi:hypothetical protein
MIVWIMHPTQLGEFTVLLFGIFDTVDVFWYWRLQSYICGKEVVAVNTAHTVAETPYFLLSS